MNKRHIYGIGAGLLLAVISWQSAPAQPWAATPAQCVDHYRRTLVFLRNNAATSGVRSELLNSLDNNPDTFQAPDPVCGKPLASSPPGLEQRWAQAQAEVLYTCAVKTTRCTIRKAQAGMDCMQAVNSCMAEFPIPAGPK